VKLAELKNEIKKYQHLEDTKIIDISLASIIASRLQIGDPVWLIIIGASSGGKSQILRPLALTDKKFLHRVDDLTENTFLSGGKSKEGEISLLNQIGEHGVIVISDLTVIFSKQAEARTAILSQFRMIYDGEMTKITGNSKEPLHWHGYLGVLAGSTPSIYSHFEEVSDMGERFIYWRMKEFDQYKATHLALSRKKFGKGLDTTLSDLYAEYLSEATKSYDGRDIEISDDVLARLIEVASFAERVRTVAHKDWSGKEIDRIPVPAMPMRVALQLMSITKALSVMRNYESGSYELLESDLSVLDWCGYSLANEEKRAVLKVLASVAFDNYVSSQIIADRIGLATNVIGIICQNLSAVGVVERSAENGVLYWKFKDERDYRVVRRIEHIEVVEVIVERERTTEEGFVDTIGDKW